MRIVGFDPLDFSCQFAVFIDQLPLVSFEMTGARRVNVSRVVEKRVDMRQHVPRRNLRPIGCPHILGFRIGRRPGGNAVGIGVRGCACRLRFQRGTFHVMKKRKTNLARLPKQDTPSYN